MVSTCPNGSHPILGNHPSYAAENSTITALLRWPRKKGERPFDATEGEHNSLALGYHNWLVVGIPTYTFEK